jgi:hypothetical protein
MSLSIAFNGAELAGTALAGGHALYVPDFLSAIGVDAAVILAVTTENDL